MSVLSAPPPYENSVRRSKSVGHPRRPKQKIFIPDTIDRLDDTSFGGHYHHGGPYDATRPSFNRNRKLSPLAATKEGNKAAWEATPRELQLDAILKGRPLDGVGIVPPGERALNGQKMDYEEGEDLMREMNPGGGAYKRWPDLQYNPNDLKGKGEPGFTIDNERKRLEAADVGRSRSTRDRERRGDYEMVPQRPMRDGKNPALVRQRSSSASAVIASSSSTSRPRSGSNLAEGLKRRLGSLRRK
ncbi:hypothetical protein M406DRAFT_356623 [Cryphonectria parasitica EP155]|uniref:Pal1 cell morphology protein n=1 Tax=Cryphonectria parasitica (strain ATCC 38755 / EP155) TaxID=660469 RepID=A0A9P4Y0Z5_CRYP1|nr:uncharacterized protein M406DRAFT_356623 [Cryphonectria parasitica EP155]KAF3764683.1 hypothetical protein M406DRAFT_356623 [Cryphonectria parasitica EP155]